MLRTVATTFMVMIAVFLVVNFTTDGAPFASPAEIALPQFGESKISAATPARDNLVSVEISALRP